jgi:tRNA A-37 threonylcarbamoyl transferase component Bud32
VTIPPGFERLLLGHAVAVARSEVAGSIRGSLLNADGTRYTLHEYAARHHSARLLHGRGAAYAVALPQSGIRVVVRHNRHGGVFAGITGDRFLSPTRAPHELEVSLALTKLGVKTPEIMAYALYPPGGLFQRSDVCSREIEDSRDLADVLTHDVESRAAALHATAQLLASLARAGARHHDLNAKNVLLTNETAYVLDVDRVTFGGQSTDVLVANLNRLGRSLRKWRDQHGARVSEREITDLETTARRAL